MYFTSYLQNGQLTISLTGEIDHHSARRYMDAISNKLETYMPEVCVLDLKDIPFMDSSGIAVLINALRHMERLGGKLFVSNMNPQPLRVFHAAGMEKILETKEVGV